MIIRKEQYFVRLSSDPYPGRRRFLPWWDKTVFQPIYKGNLVDKIEVCQIHPQTGIIQGKPNQRECYFVRLTWREKDVIEELRRLLYAKGFVDNIPDNKTQNNHALWFAYE